MSSTGRKRKKKPKNSSEKKTNKEIEMISSSDENLSDTQSSDSFSELNKALPISDSNLISLSERESLKKTASTLPSKNNFIGFKTMNAHSNNSTRINPNNLPECTRFMYIQPQDDNVSLKKYNPFGIKKSLEVIADGSIKSARFCRSGSLLVETHNFEQSKKIFHAKSLINNSLPIKVTVAHNFNTSQGTIFAPELEDLTDEEILQELAPQQVQAVRRILKGKNKLPTHIIILTFGRAEIPENLFCGYIFHKLRPYYPAPLRCYICQRFGHRGKFCKNQPSCGFCSESHQTLDCQHQSDAKCTNCNGKHPSYSRECKNI